MMPAPPNSRPPGPAARPAAGLSGVALLIEDDDAVRAVTRRMLEMHGLTVLPAAGPADALRAAAGYLGRIDVLVTDVRLPVMTGPELVVRLRADRPNLGVVLISGGLREEALGDLPGNDRVEFLSKPFTPAQLAAALRKVLSPGADTTPRPPETQRLPRPGPDATP